jgi:EmrB/QacA subfamily drug resistance transporter
MNQKIAVSIVYVASLFMTIMDSTIVNVALPTIARDLQVKLAAVDSVVIGFMVSLAVFIPAAGWLGDRFGGRRVLLVSIAIFTVSSALCGFAASLGELVIFRVLQGVGGGMMTPVGMAMLFRTFPPRERVRASGILIVPTALAPALGPVIGGLLVSDLSWRWVFFINVPIGALVLAFGVMFLDAFTGEHPGRFDVPGFVLAALGLGLLMYGVSEGPVEGWHTPSIIATCVAGVTLLIALVVVEQRVQLPVIKLALLRDRLFRSCSAVLVLASLPFLGMLFLIALFYQEALGLSPVATGLSTFPEAIGVMIGSQVVTRTLYPTFGPRRVMVGGLLLLAVSIGLMSLVGLGTNLWWMRTLVFVTGIGMSAVIVPSQAAGFATISMADTAGASTMYNGLRYLSGAVGVAVLTTVLAAIGPTHVVGGHKQPNLASYQIAFLVAGGVALLAVLVALTVSDHEARFTIVQRKPGRPAPPDRALAVDGTDS